MEKNGKQGLCRELQAPGVEHELETLREAASVLVMAPEVTNTPPPPIRSVMAPEVTDKNLPAPHPVMAPGVTDNPGGGPGAESGEAAGGGAVERGGVRGRGVAGGAAFGLVNPLAQSQEPPARACPHVTWTRIST
eukprot:1774437-Rhodomonas_salina.1